MLPGEKRKPNYYLWGFLFIMAAYLGYILGTFGKITNFSEAFVESVKYRCMHPFPVVISQYTGPYVMLMVSVWGLAFIYSLTTMHTYMSGSEYGTARFARPAELNKDLENRKVDDNKRLSKHLRLTRDTRKTRLNNNALFMGGSGAGKTTMILTPNLLEIDDKRSRKLPKKRVSKIFTDPKGEILRDNGNYLVSRGDNVRVLDLIKMQNSDHYNPISYIRKETDVIKLITNLISNTTPKDASKGDPFWEKAEGMYLMAILFYVWLECPPEEKNFRSVLKLLNMAEIPEDETEQSDLDKLMFELDPEHPALLSYNKVRRGATDTVRSIIISANSRLAFMQNEDVLRILDYDDMDLPFLGRGKNYDGKTITDLFCVIPDSDKSYNFIVGMLYTQLFQELYYQADFECGGVLEVETEFWLDEFANVALPDDFISLESTMRSRGISVNIIIQFMGQLKALFKDLEEGVVANCDTFVYLGGNEQSSFKYVSERIGKWTIDKQSFSDSKGRNGSSSASRDVLGRELMTPDEVGRMDINKEIIMIKGRYPVIDDKFIPFKTREFKEARSMGPYKKINYGEYEMFKGYSTKELKYMNDRRKQSGQDPVDVWKPDLMEILSLDIGSIDDTEVSEIDLKDILKESAGDLQASLEVEKKSRNELDDGKPRDPEKKITMETQSVDTNTIGGRMAAYSYSEEQMKEALKGLGNGLTEEQVLMYFLPEFSATKMASMRKLYEKVNHA